MNALEIRAKQFLESYWEYGHAINSKIQQAREHKELATILKSVDYTKERVQISTGNEAAFEKNIQKAIDLEKEALKLVDGFYKNRLEIEKAIESASDSTQRSVLRYRYINGYTQEETAEKMELSKRWISEVEGRAIQYIGKYLKNNNILHQTSSECILIPKSL